MPVCSEEVPSCLEDLDVYYPRSGAADRQHHDLQRSGKAARRDQLERDVRQSPKGPTQGAALPNASARTAVVGRGRGPCRDRGMGCPRGAAQMRNCGMPRDYKAEGL